MWFGLSSIRTLSKCSTGTKELIISSIPAHNGKWLLETAAVAEKIGHILNHLSPTFKSREDCKYWWTTKLKLLSFNKTFLGATCRTTYN